MTSHDKGENREHTQIKTSIITKIILSEFSFVFLL